jgi:hypothetical protein
MAVMDTDDLIGRKALADLLHVSESVIGGWRDRAHRLNPPFPDPVLFSRPPYWNVVVVVEWWLNFVPGNPGFPKVGYLDDEQYWRNRIKERKG